MKSKLDRLFAVLINPGSGFPGLTQLNKGCFIIHRHLPIFHPFKDTRPVKIWGTKWGNLRAGATKFLTFYFTLHRKLGGLCGFDFYLGTVGA